MIRFYVCGSLAEPPIVDPASRMLDPHADREGLDLNMRPIGVERVESVACAMADDEDEPLRSFQSTLGY